mgnify:FL=1
MLATKIKNENEILKYFENKVIVFKCFGCKEVYFPEEKINEFLKNNNQNIIEIIRIDYLCNEDFAETIVNKNIKKFEKCENIIVFSCGVGVQVISKILIEDKKVYKNINVGCDSFCLDGFQGITAQKYSCSGCEECYLNWTGGICPFTSCAKGLLNGPCGGADKNGKCEVDKSIDCAWIKIYEKMKKLGIDKNLKKNNVFIKDYLKMGREKKSPL